MSNSRRVLWSLAATASLLSLTPSAEARYGEPLWRTESVAMNEVQRVPSQIVGQFRVSGEQKVVDMARAYLRSVQSQLGHQNVDTDLQVQRVIERDELGMGHVRFQHVVAGVPVFASELWVHTKGDVVTGLNGSYLPSFRASARPVVLSEDAGDLAADYVQDLIHQDLIASDVASRELGVDVEHAPKLVFYNQGLLDNTRTPTVLAWHVRVSGYEVMVNARTGAIVDGWDAIHTALSREIYTAKNTTNTPGTLVCKEGTGCSTNDQDANLAYDQFGETWNYFKNTHSRDSYDNKGGKLIGTVHYSQNFVNAYWDGKQMVFGDNMVADDVTAHELGHGVCQYTAGLVYKNQSGALNESYSDVWGVMVDREDWLMGEDLPIGAIRSMSDPGAYSQPKDMTEYKNYKFYDNGGVHINSGIPNYASYLLADGGTNQGVKVIAQGREKVEKIWYRVETTKLTSSSQFKDFANAAVTACGELYGGTTSVTCKEVTNAFKAVKIL